MRSDAMGGLVAPGSREIRAQSLLLRAGGPAAVPYRTLTACTSNSIGYLAPYAAIELNRRQCIFA